MLAARHYGNKKLVKYEISFDHRLHARETDGGKKRMRQSEIGEHWAVPSLSLVVSTWICSGFYGASPITCSRLKLGYAGYLGDLCSLMKFGKTKRHQFDCAQSVSSLSAGVEARVVHIDDKNIQSLQGRVACFVR